MEIKKYIIICWLLIFSGLLVTAGQVIVKDGELNVTQDLWVGDNIQMQADKKIYMGDEYAYSNGTCLIIQGGSSTLEIC